MERKKEQIFKNTEKDGTEISLQGALITALPKEYRKFTLYIKKESDIGRTKTERVSLTKKLKMKKKLKQEKERLPP